MTKQKKIVLRIIEQSYEHPTAEDIFFKAREEMPNIALGTVYRNLTALAEEGTIRRITLPGSPDRFDTKAKSHDHIVCRKCGKIKDIHLSGVEKALAEATGEEISFYELNAYYVCGDCREKETSGSIK